MDDLRPHPAIPTAHPRRMAFPAGGEPRPATWARRGEEPPGPRTAALLEHPDVADVLDAGHLVIVGLASGVPWADRIDGVLETMAVASGTIGSDPPPHPDGPAGLLLLDPAEHRERLVDALGDPDPLTRSAAVSMLGVARDGAVRKAVLVTGFHDPHPMVRRAAVDEAAGLDDPEYRPLFEEAVDDPDRWVRRRAVEALRSLGAAASLESLMLAAVDDDPDVRAAAEGALEDVI
jgi:hypothetical protein